MPTNDTTKTLDYDQRLLISNNELHPIAWYVTNINDVQPLGITQIVFSQSQFDPERDNAELMIADYYSSNLTPEEKIDPPPKPIGDHSRITFNGTQQVLKINGSYKTFTPHFYDHDFRFGESLLSFLCILQPATAGFVVKSLSESCPRFGFKV